MDRTAEKYRQIKGWGIDADPKNEPTYPVKNYTGDDHKRLNYEKPPQQRKTTEVLHSNERPTLSAVYGTSVPLSGLSGFLRRLAFRYSESSFGHWLPLIFADRINIIEGLFSDLRKGHIPDIYKEKGIKAELTYNRTAFITTTAVKVVVTVVVLAWIFSGIKKKRKRY